MIEQFSKATTAEDLITENQNGLKLIAARKHGYISRLMTNQKQPVYDMLVNFSWEAVVLEFARIFPGFFCVSSSFISDKADHLKFDNYLKSSLFSIEICVPFFESRYKCVEIYFFHSS